MVQPLKRLGSLPKLLETWETDQTAENTSAPALVFSEARGWATAAPARVPCEAEVFLNHLNAISLPATPGPAGVFSVISAAPSSTYLKERIRAVRHENRDLRECLEKIYKKNQRLRDELSIHLLDKQRLKEELCRVEAKSQAADLCLQDIMASLNWRLAHRFHRLWRGFKQYLLPAKWTSGASTKD
jgi:hypothetical protein